MNLVALPEAPQTRGIHERAGIVSIVNQTTVSFWEETVDEGMVGFFRSLLSRMRARGWRFKQDPMVKDLPLIARHYRVGKKGNLSVDARVSGRVIEVTFYQELVVEHLNGARYDYEKLDRITHVSRALRLQCLVEMAAVLKKATEHGYTLKAGLDGANLLRSVRDTAEWRYDVAHEDDPVVEFNRKWDSAYEKEHGTHRFERDERGWPTVKEYGNYNSDRDGRPLRCGEIKYFYSKGRLQRASIFTNMGNMWRAVFGGQVAYVSGYELFDCPDPAAVPRRLVPNQKERLETLVKKAVEKKDYARVETLGRVLRRMP